MTHADVHNALHAELDIGLPTNLNQQSTGHLAHHAAIAAACPDLGLDTTPTAGESGHTAATALLASGAAYGPKFGRQWVIDHAGPNSVGSPGGSPIEITTADVGSINTILSSNPGATFFFRAGTYNRTSAVVPKTNQTLVFEDGAILDGGFNNNGAGIFINTAESGVTIRGGVVRNYGTNSTGQNGRGILTNAPNTTLTDVTVHDVFLNGLAIQGSATNCTVLRADLYDNGRAGISGAPNNHTLKHSKIHGNNTQGNNPGNEGGAFKFLFSGHGICQFNHIFENHGFAAWWDTDNWDWDVSQNVIEDNERSGFFFEGNYGGMVGHHNYIKNNGKNITIGGQLPTISNCVNVRLSDNSGNRTDPDGFVRPVEFYRNIVDNTDFSGNAGKLFTMWDHTDSSVRHVSNNDVYENQFWIRDTNNQHIRCRDEDTSPQGGTPTTDFQVWVLDNHFWENEYHVTSTTAEYWMWDTGTGFGENKTYTEWQAFHAGETLSLIQI